MEISTAVDVSVDAATFNNTHTLSDTATVASEADGISDSVSSSRCHDVERLTASAKEHGLWPQSLRYRYIRISKKYVMPCIITIQRVGLNDGRTHDTDSITSMERISSFGEKWFFDSGGFPVLAEHLHPIIHKHLQQHNQWDCLDAKEILRLQTMNHVIPTDAYDATVSFKPTSTNTQSLLIPKTSIGDVEQGLKRRRCETSELSLDALLVCRIIGVLALQGAFKEHVKMLESFAGVECILIRSSNDLLSNSLDGLILPGGESTSMALIAERTGLLTPLRSWLHTMNKPIWGTCAGLILLSDHAEHLKRGGQVLLGGLDVHVDRNHFGTQLQSFEADLNVPVLGSDMMFRGIFIRAPAVIKVGEGVDILASLTKGRDMEEVIVAVRQGRLLGTAFHPELTNDTRFHAYFINMVHQSKSNKDMRESTNYDIVLTHG